MTQTPRRSGIRLPWSHDDEVEDEQQDETRQTASAEAATGDTQGDAGSAPSRAPVADAAPSQPEPEASEADNALLASLVAAMRDVAERERSASVASLKASADEAIERLHARAAEGAEQLRTRADLDVAGIGDWVKVETERIESEGRTKTDTRRQQLATQLAEHEQRSRHEVESVTERVAAYERELDTFFTQLYEIADPAAFGTAAKRMPRPPVLGAGSEPAPAPVPPAAETAAPPPVPDVIDTPGAAAEPAAAAAEPAAAAAEPVAGETEPEPDAEGETAPAVEVPEAGANGSAPVAAETLRDRMDALGISREPAAMPGETVEATAVPGTQEAPEGSDEPAGETDGLAARLRELDARIGSGVPAQGATASVPAPAAGGEEATAIMVAGLGSFGAITSFKQALERVEGVHGISLSLGPTGEFVYRATHAAGFDLAAAIAEIERGTAKVDRQADGSLRVTVQRGR